MLCDRITWPDLSALRVLELMTDGYYHERKLQTLLPHLSLESLTVQLSGDKDCVAIGNHVMSTTSLKELCIISSDRMVKTYTMEDITAAIVSNQSLPLERLKFKCKCTFTSPAGDSLAQFITNTTTLTQ